MDGSWISRFGLTGVSRTNALLGRFLPQLCRGFVPCTRRFSRAPTMTKAEKIRRTARKHPDWSTIAIGVVCDCSDSYVRTALRQRVDGRKSASDARYDEKFKAEHGLLPASARNKRRYHNDPEYRAAEIARTTAIQKARSQKDPEYRKRRNAQALASYHRRRAQREAAHANPA